MDEPQDGSRGNRRESEQERRAGHAHGARSPWCWPSSSGSSGSSTRRPPSARPGEPPSTSWWSSDSGSSSPTPPSPPRRGRYEEARREMSDFFTRIQTEQWALPPELRPWRRVPRHARRRHHRPVTWSTRSTPASCSGCWTASRPPAPPRERRPRRAPAAPTRQTRRRNRLRQETRGPPVSRRRPVRALQRLQRRPVPLLQEVVHRVEIERGVPVQVRPHVDHRTGQPHVLHQLPDGRTT
jgi:hypothetical protein